MEISSSPLGRNFFFFNMKVEFLSIKWIVFCICLNALWDLLKPCTLSKCWAWRANTWATILPCPFNVVKLPPPHSGCNLLWIFKCWLDPWQTILLEASKKVSTIPISLANSTTLLTANASNSSISWLEWIFSLRTAMTWPHVSLLTNNHSYACTSLLCK